MEGYASKTKPVADTQKGTVIVTGGSRGIGAAICKRLAADGFAVVVNYAGSLASAEEVASYVVKAGGIAKVVQADVSSEAGVQQLFTQFDSSEMPALAGLVNNAGIVIGGVDMDKVANEEDYNKIMNINVLGPLLCCREAAKRMGTGKGGKGGNIVNISSGAASTTGNMLYSMSKAALNAMSNNLVRPMAEQGIRVNTVTPGVTETDLVTTALKSGAKLPFDAATIPMGRFGKPEEIADAVSYMMSDGASYVSGANIRVSGGMFPGTFIG